MFTDKRFKLKFSVDKRGRPEAQTSGENLKKFYELEDSDDDEAEDDEDDEGEVQSRIFTEEQTSKSKEGKGKMRRKSGRELLQEFRQRKAHDE